MRLIFYIMGIATGFALCLLLTPHPRDVEKHAVAIRDAEWAKYLVEVKAAVIDADGDFCVIEEYLEPGRVW